MIPDFEDDTRTMREWLRGGGVSTDHLIAELELWADYWAQANAENEGIALSADRREITP